MANLPVKKSFHLLRRSYAVAAETAKVQPAMASAIKNPITDLKAEGERKEVFWMRDPKTGNWIPESHFGEVDVADLREKFLFKEKI